MLGFIETCLEIFFEGVLAPVWRFFDVVFGSMSLSALSIIMGFLCCLPAIYGLKKVQAFAEKSRQFPRYTPVGVVLMAVGTLWFLYNVRAETISDFASFKLHLLALFFAIGLGTCIFVRDFLPVRALAVLLLLAAKLMVDSGRPLLGQTAWVLVIQVWAYVMVIAGMWLTISPWRLRDMINWATATEKRARLLCGVRLAFGILVIVLGLTVYRAAEKRRALEASLPVAPPTALISAAVSV